MFSLLYKNQKYTRLHADSTTVRVITCYVENLFGLTKKHVQGSGGHKIREVDL